MLDRRAALKTFAAPFLASLIPSQAQTAPPPASEAFDEIWRTTRDMFYDPKMHGVDWQAIGARYRPLAAAAGSRLEFQAVVNRMLDELHASHAGYYTDDDFECHLLRSMFAPAGRAAPIPHIGVMGERRDGVFTVRGPLDGGPAAQAAIQSGDRLLQAAGESFTTAGSFRGQAGKPVEIVVERPSVGTRTLTVFPVAETPAQAYAMATARSARVLRAAGRSIGYVHLWTLTHTEVLDAYEAAIRDTLMGTDGLVLDLRDGYGGRPAKYEDVFFRPPIRMETRPRGADIFTAVNGYAKPIVAIVNGGTRSAKEYLAFSLQKSGRATLVGARTAGAFLLCNISHIGSDSVLLLPIADLRIDGVRLEGVGVRPDSEVPAGANYTPADRQFAAAVDVLLEQLIGV